MLTERGFFMVFDRFVIFVVRHCSKLHCRPRHNNELGNQRMVSPCFQPTHIRKWVYRGMLLLSCAASINASKSKPEIFGISIAPAAVVEGFAVFAFVFAMVLAASVPGMGE